MLLFRSEEHVDRWLAERRLNRGGLVTPEQLWRLAVAWYGKRLAPDWRRATPEEGQRVLEGIGLSGPFWRLRG